MAQMVGKIAESDGPCQCIDCGCGATKHQIKRREERAWRKEAEDDA